MNYGPLDFVGNVGVVVLMVTYLMLQLNRLRSDELAYSAPERDRRELDRHFTALQFQSFRPPDGSVLGSD